MAERYTLNGATQGYKLGAVFELIGGGVWQQTCGTYDYQYQWRPEVILDDSSGRLKIDEMEDWVYVRRVG